jgi:hypothetical protein
MKNERPLSRAEDRAEILPIQFVYLNAARIATDDSTRYGRGAYCLGVRFGGLLSSRARLRFPR